MNSVSSVRAGLVVFRASGVSLVVVSASGLGTMSFVGGTWTGTAGAMVVVRTSSGVFLALFVSAVAVSSTNPGALSLVAWTGAGTACAENFVCTGSVAFGALGVCFVSSTNSGTVPFVGKVCTEEAGTRYVLRSGSCALSTLRVSLLVAGKTCAWVM